MQRVSVPIVGWANFSFIQCFRSWHQGNRSTCVQRNDITLLGWDQESGSRDYTTGISRNARESSRRFVYVAMFSTLACFLLLVCCTVSYLIVLTLILVLKKLKKLKCCAYVLLLVWMDVTTGMLCRLSIRKCGQSVGRNVEWLSDWYVRVVMWLWLRLLIEGKESAIRMYADELVGVSCSALESPSWPVRAQGAGAIATIAETMGTGCGWVWWQLWYTSYVGSNLRPAYISTLTTALLTALSGRVWDGKVGVWSRIEREGQGVANLHVLCRKQLLMHSKCCVWAVRTLSKVAKT